MRRFIAFFLFTPLFCLAQTARVDSLRQLFAVTFDQDKKMELAFALCEEKQSLNTELLSRYATEAKKLATLKKDLPKISLAESYFANCLIKKGLLDSAMQVCINSLQKLNYTDKMKKPYIRFSILNGQILLKKSRYKEALQQFYKLLAEAETKDDAMTQVSAITNIGWVNMEMGQNKEALNWFYKALAREGGTNFSKTNDILFINLAATFNNLKQNDSADYYIKKAIISCRKNEDLQYLANALAVQAGIFIDAKRVSEAEAPLTEAVNIRLQIGEPYYIVSDMMELSNYYAHNKQAVKGIKICLEGISIASKNNLDSKLLILYTALAENYKVAGMSGKCEEALEKIISLKDSIYRKNSSETLAEMQTKYEVQKKQNRIDQQRYELAKEKFLLFGLVVLLLFVTIFSLLLFKQNKKRQHLKLQMILEEDNLMSKIAVAAGKENERKRIAAELHDNLGGQLTYITSNIDFILDAPAQLSEQEKKKRLEKVNETAHNTMADLRETIWALNKEAMGMDELADKLKVFAKTQLSFNSTLLLEVKEDITGKTILSSAETLHVFRIFQEGIQNAIKHSAADKIVLTIKTNRPDSYAISLTDNGKGFVEGAYFAGHYGLENMKERAKQIDAVLLIVSEEGKGTTVHLTKENSANELL
jgi:two-component system, NarL family, sensor kinase